MRDSEKQEYERKNIKENKKKKEEKCVQQMSNRTQSWDREKIIEG